MSRFVSIENSPCRAIFPLHQRSLELVLSNGLKKMFLVETAMPFPRQMQPNQKHSFARLQNSTRVEWQMEERLQAFLLQLNSLFLYNIQSAKRGLKTLCIQSIPMSARVRLKHVLCAKSLSYFLDNKYFSHCRYLQQVVSRA